MEISSPGAGLCAHLRSLLALLALDLLLFHSLVLHPTQVLYSPHSDFLAEHLPAKRFLVRSYQQTGELPLWCPHHFAGSPFVHDIQVSLFYPPHLALLPLQEEAVGPALSWLVVLHLLLAGWSMYGYSLHRGLTPVSAFVAGMGFMFGGRWLMHLLAGGHTILIGLAWLPLVLLGWERAVQRRSLAWALLAAVSFALLTLSTQPQWTFYSGLFAALWTFGLVREEGGRRLPTLIGWAGTGALIVVLTLGLTAIQLLPTLEAASQSSRGGGVGVGGILDGGLRVLVSIVGRPITGDPFNTAWEDRGGLALLWLIAVVWAAVLVPGRARYEAGVCLGLFLFALGGAILFQPLPGFSLFRQPARMIVVAMFPVAFLAGVAVQALSAPRGLTEEQLIRCRRWLRSILIAVLLLVGGFAFRLGVIERKTMLLDGIGYLVVAGSLAGVAWWLLQRPHRATHSLAWAGLLGLDLFLLVVGLGTTSAEEDVYRVPQGVRAIKELNEPGRILDVGHETQGRGGFPLGQGAPLALILGLDAVRGYSPLDVLRYREFLQLIADGDEPLRAFDSTFTFPLVGNFPVVNRSLLDLLGVRYLITPEDAPPGPGWRLIQDRHNAKVYDLVAGGLVTLQSYRVFENERVLPRAFVVPKAHPLPPRDHLLATFKRTDFSAVVYLEEWDGVSPEPATPAGRHTVRVLADEPNRVRLAVEGPSPGFLVLRDVWFPGWTCIVEGKPAKVHRANYTFRAVEVPAGTAEIEFRFEPRSYLIGRWITLFALVLVTILAIAAFVLPPVSSVGPAFIGRTQFLCK